MASGLLDLQAEGHRVVDDTNRVQLNAVLGLTHNHRSSAVQVDTDVLVPPYLLTMRRDAAVAWDIPRPPTKGPRRRPFTASRLWISGCSALS